VNLCILNPCFSAWLVVVKILLYMREANSTEVLALSHNNFWFSRERLVTSSASNSCLAALILNSKFFRWARCLSY
jgi:hypothetical protein